MRDFIIPGEVGKMSFFRQFKHFGPNISDCADTIVDRSPEMVFVSCFAFCYSPETISLTDEIKTRLPQIPIVAGGSGVSAYPEYFLTQESIDYAIVGEAEVSLHFFLEQYFHNMDWGAVPNLYWKQNGVIHKPQITKQTQPGDLKLIWQSVRETNQTCFVSAAYSRGCTQTCRFCSARTCHGKGFRIPSQPEFVKGTKSMARFFEQGSKPIRLNFEDDNLLLSPEPLFALLSTLKSINRDVSFCFENGVDIGLLTPSLLQRLFDAGVCKFNLSLVSINRHVLAAEQREQRIHSYEAAIQKISDHGIDSVTYFICGLEHDSPKTAVENLAYLSRWPTIIGFSPFYPVPGLPGFSNRRLFDKLSPRLAAGSSMFPWTASLATRQLVSAFRLSRFLNLVKSKHVSETEQNLIALTLSSKKLHTLVRVSKTGARPPSGIPAADGQRIVPVPHMDEDLVRDCLDSARTNFRSKLG